MKFKKIGSYRDNRGGLGQDRGLHLVAVGIKGPKRYQTISNGLLDETAYRKLIHGAEAEIPWIFPSDLLEKIDS